ncbi:MAG TPA: cytochrome c3 family protein [Vicinamibacterales bacterium]|nr:cytochrome c3 family protein [Vicinamibacterales bacterium]
MKMRVRLLAVSGWLLGTAAAVLAQSPNPSVTADQARALFQNDVHQAAGLTCTACHDQAKGDQYAAPARAGIPKLCGSCHTNASYMKQFNPQLRVDQYPRYLTSTHGKQITKGELRVAVCSDCHGAHGILSVKDPRAPVYPTNVAKTCARCHADPARMTPFNKPATPPEEWSQSVHAKALLERNDTSAPTCSTCHGSHGAAPPDVENVALVCAQCHVREAELFRKSPKKKLFDSLAMPECVTCHSNHHIVEPQDSWLGFEGDIGCAKCHDDSIGGADVIKGDRKALDDLSAAIAAASDRLGRAERAGMIIDDGRAALREASDQRVLARVSMHAFAAQPLADDAAKGLKSAQLALADADAALAEVQYRRKGLAVATIFIAGFLVTLGLKIRRLNRGE